MFPQDPFDRFRTAPPPTSSGQGAPAFTPNGFGHPTHPPPTNPFRTPQAQNTFFPVVTPHPNQSLVVPPNISSFASGPQYNNNNNSNTAPTPTPHIWSNLTPVEGGPSFASFQKQHLSLPPWIPGVSQGASVFPPNPPTLLATLTSNTNVAWAGTWLRLYPSWGNDGPSPERELYGRCCRLGEMIKHLDKERAALESQNNEDGYEASPLGKARYDELVEKIENLLKEQGELVLQLFKNRFP
ncbi:hypothetical protein BGX33_007022 [Mortierella sp. NVP41]|nr:hypothetical protein BGX33_007022 [Mortierella sp. NVP41]